MCFYKPVDRQSSFGCVVMGKLAMPSGSRLAPSFIEGTYVPPKVESIQCLAPWADGVKPWFAIDEFVHTRVRISSEHQVSPGFGSISAESMIHMAPC